MGFSNTGISTSAQKNGAFPPLRLKNTLPLEALTAGHNITVGKSMMKINRKLENKSHEYIDQK